MVPYYLIHSEFTTVTELETYLARRKDQISSKINNFK